MTTNATVEARHKDMAAEAFGYSSWTRLSHSEGPRITAIALAQAQDKANLEAARAENADLANRLAEIDRFANAEMTAQSWNGSTLPRIAALASGHTPSPCPHCAAKDEAMAAFKAEVSRVMRMMVGMDFQSNRECLAQPFIIPPADPLAEALKALIAEHGVEVSDAGFDAMLAWHKGELQFAGIGASRRNPNAIWHEVVAATPALALAAAALKARGE